MRKVIVSNLISLDGYMEGQDGNLDWFVVNDEFLEYSRNLFKEIDTMLWGRKTYQLMESYWPKVENDDPTITHNMNKLPKIVFSRTLDKVTWNNTSLIKENITEEVFEMKKKPGKDIIIFGSGELLSQLAQAGLIDEYRIILNPLILGKGRPMFKNINEQLKLKLIKAKKLKTGVIILYYHPAQN